MICFHIYFLMQLLIITKAHKGYEINKFKHNSIFVVVSYVLYFGVLFSSLGLNSEALHNTYVAETHLM